MRGDKIKFEITDELACGIRNAVFEAGAYILSASDGGSDIERDIKIKPGDDNFATAWDSAAQKMLVGSLSALLPEAGFLAEEDGMDIFRGDAGKPVFVIDPIDGTTNFIHCCRHSAVSVAVIYEGEPVLGCVYDPYLDEMFYAQAGGGAFLFSRCGGEEARRLHVSSRTIRDALVSFGTSPYDKGRAQATFELVLRAFRLCRDVRRGGSAALDICYVAAGRYDLFFELTLSPWDFAAAAVILREAGGEITDLDGGAVSPEGSSPIAASNGVCSVREL